MLMRLQKQHGATTQATTDDAFATRHCVHQPPAHPVIDAKAPDINLAVSDDTASSLNSRKSTN